MALELVLLFLKSIAMYLIIYCLIRLNSKGIGKRTLYDYALMIIVGTVAADPLKDHNILGASIALLGLSTGHLLVTTAVRANWARFLLHGKPKYLIQAGEFNLENFYASKLTVPELYSELRLNGHGHLSEIEWAALEPSRKISFIPKSNWQTTVQVPSPLIADGVIQTNTLTISGKSVDWLQQHLIKTGIADCKEVLIAELRNQDELFLIRRK